MKLLQFMYWKICCYKFEWELLTLIKKMCEYDLIWKLERTSAQQYMQYVWFRQLWVGFHVNRLCGVQIFLQLLHSVRRKYVINNWIMIIEFSVCTTNMTHRSRGSMNYCKCPLNLDPLSPPYFCYECSCSGWSHPLPLLVINKIWWVMKKVVLLNIVYIVGFAVFIMVV